MEYFSEEIKTTRTLSTLKQNVTLWFGIEFKCGFRVSCKIKQQQLNKQQNTLSSSPIRLGLSFRTRYELVLIQYSLLIYVYSYEMCFNPGFCPA